MNTYFRIWVTVVLLVLATATGFAKNSSLGQSQRSIEQVLYADGTINMHSGYTGSIDTRGYKMVVNKQNQPFFIKAEHNGTNNNIIQAAGDEYWDNRFYYNGFDAPVNAMATDGTNIYVGGEFTQVGNIAVNYIAKWDGSA